MIEYDQGHWTQGYIVPMYHTHLLQHKNMTNTWPILFTELLTFLKVKIGTLT